MTTVAHARNHQNVTGAKIAYIGRPSKYGNDHPHGRACPICCVTHTKAEAIARFRQYWYAAPQAKLRAEALVELRDAVLLCHCHPNACHGDVIAEFVNQHYARVA